MCMVNDLQSLLMTLVWLINISDPTGRLAKCVKIQT